MTNKILVVSVQFGHCEPFEQALLQLRNPMMLETCYNNKITYLIHTELKFHMMNSQLNGQLGMHYVWKNIYDQ